MDKVEEKGRVGDLAAAKSEAQLANKLERLSAPLAEKVIQSAIELHQQDTHDDGSVAWDEVERIGLELGIGPEIMRRALREALEVEHVDAPRGFFDKLLGISEISGGALADGDREVVRERLKEWMADLENMAPTGREGSTTSWEARGTATYNTKALHHYGPVLTRQTEVADGDQLIEMTVDTAKMKKEAAIIVGAMAIPGAILGAMLAGLGSSPPDFLPGFLEFFLPFLGFGGGGLAIAALNARQAVKAVRQSVQRALSGVASLSTDG